MKMRPELMTFIVQQAVQAAATVAQRDKKSPVDAAMHVACAGLIAHRQLALADDETEQLPSDIPAKAFEAAGFTTLSPEVTAAMRQLGLTPLLRAGALHAVIEKKAA